MAWWRTWPKKKLKHVWEFGTQGVLWRLLASRNGLFVGEDRDVDAKSVSFFCLDRISGNVLWKNIHFDERWWIGMEAVHDDVLFLHEYATPDLPEHKNIYAVSLATGSTKWINTTLTFLFAYKGYVYASQDSFDHRKFFELDVQTGAVTREVEVEYVNALRDIAFSNAVEQIELPRPENTLRADEINVLRAIEKVRFGAKRIGQIEYLDKNPFVILGYYDNVSKNPTSEVFNQHLVVFEGGQSQVVLQEMIATGLATSLPGTFFCIEDYLYYIRDKKVLTSINCSTNS